MSILKHAKADRVQHRTARRVPPFDLADGIPASHTHPKPKAGAMSFSFVTPTEEGRRGRTISLMTAAHGSVSVSVCEKWMVKFYSIHDSGRRYSVMVHKYTWAQRKRKT
jgi:hypothetical protein